MTNRKQILMKSRKEINDARIRQDERNKIAPLIYALYANIDDVHNRSAKKQAKELCEALSTKEEK